MACEAAFPEEEYLDGVGHIAVKIIEEAVNEACADDDGSHEGVGEVCGGFGVFVFLFVSPTERHIADGERESEEHPVISDLEGADTDEGRIPVPGDQAQRVEEIKHVLLRI